MSGEEIHKYKQRLKSALAGISSDPKLAPEDKKLLADFIQHCAAQGMSDGGRFKLAWMLHSIAKGDALHLPEGKAQGHRKTRSLDKFSREIQAELEIETKEIRLGAKATRDQKCVGSNDTFASPLYDIPNASSRRPATTITLRRRLAECNQKLADNLNVRFGRHPGNAGHFDGNGVNSSTGNYTIMCCTCIPFGFALIIFSRLKSEALRWGAEHLIGDLSRRISNGDAGFRNTVSNWRRIIANDGLEEDSTPELNRSVEATEKDEALVRD